MKVFIYQIDLERDDHNVAFLSYDRLQRAQDSQEIDEDIYDCVFEGEVECNTLEDVYEMFNLDHPRGFKGHSLSVSDVVEVVDGGDVSPGFYFCDSVGFKEVEFDPTESRLSPNFLDGNTKPKLNVLLVKAGQYPEMVEIPDSLESLQAAVGGYVEQFCPFEDEVALLCNEEGKLNGLPLNRAVYTEPPYVEMSYAEMKAKFRDAEEQGKHLEGRIVFSQESFDKEYPIESRTYLVSSQNKAFQPGMGGYSIFGTAMDGSDPLVRLDCYMAAEKGGKDGWKVETCYCQEEPREMMDIIAGDFLVVLARPESENFESLPPDLSDKYSKLFKYPENFMRVNGDIVAVPYRPQDIDHER